ncbi:MAG: type I secretion system permease/ATPase [Rhodospirillales bacterium]|nr:type I secretion system permease/ATPase [Rhodospirillales bacterium]
MSIRGALAACRKGFNATVLFSLFANLLLFVSPLYMLQVYDRVLTSRSEATLVMLTVIAGGLLAVLAALELVRSRVLVRTGARIDRHLGARVFGAVFQRSLSSPGGAHGQPLRDLDTLREFASGAGVQVLCDAPWAPLFIAVAFILHPLLGLVSLAGAVIIFGLALINEFSTRRLLREAMGESIAAGAFAETSLRNAEVLSAMGMMPGMARRWMERHERAMARQQLAADRSGTLMALSKFVRLFLQSLVLGAGAWLAIRQEITPGAIIAASIIMGRALAPVELAVGQWKNFIAARGAYKRLSDLLAAVPAPAAAMPLPRPEGRLEVERAVVVPPGGRTPVLKGVSFALQPGEVLGIVGPSAAGKSTLARLLVGVWPAASGAVRLDGADVHAWRSDDLGPHIGYLPQDVELFDGTVADNIARFLDYDPGGVVLAARKAGVHDVILHLPDGYDTRIGEGGRVLSGGQRQRVGLARAIYGDPSLVVLDEPNSNLDTAGEQALVEALGALRERKTTTVVITHRLNILGCVDKILVLRDGVAEFFGPRDEVMARLARPTVVAANPRQEALQAPNRAASQ